jgi:hypothetical protein
MRNIILLAAVNVTLAGLLAGCASVPQKSARGGVLSGTEVERQRYSVKRDPMLAGNGPQDVGQSSAALSNGATPMPSAPSRAPGTTAPTAAPGTGAAGASAAGTATTPGTGATSTSGTIVVGGSNAGGGAGTSATPAGTGTGTTTPPAGTPNDTTTGATTGAQGGTGAEKPK